jgi:hypothetical protein
LPIISAIASFARPQRGKALTRGAPGQQIQLTFLQVQRAQQSQRGHAPYVAFLKGAIRAADFIMLAMISVAGDMGGSCSHRGNC